MGKWEAEEDDTLAVAPDDDLDEVRLPFSKFITLWENDTCEIQYIYVSIRHIVPTAMLSENRSLAYFTL